MVAVFAVLGFMVLLLIYFVVRQQSLQRETSQLKHSVKSIDSQNKQIFNTMVLLSGELQKSYLERLNQTQKHGLISKDDYEITAFLLNKFSFIVAYCSEKNATVEEAVKKSLEASDYDLETISQFIAKQPNEIKIPWTKNQLNGFISSCHHLCAGPKMKKAESSQSPPEK